ncbi:unnamed protein product [Echinostoma caproni]|uniref:PH domain-containing protein n=1 Tax=Echinostoma caproni TaxID=27848 RepID=A0A183ASF3_9TREM|nr:unnamed protein product [Echinostoma caproni]
MLPETELFSLTDSDGAYLEFTDSQPFVTLVNCTNPSLTQWVQEQSSSSVFSASPGQSTQSTNFSSGSSPLVEATSFAEQLSSDKAELCEESHGNFVHYTDDLGFVRTGDAYG